MHGQAGDIFYEQKRDPARLLGAVWDKAVTYGRQAEEKAIARPAYREAVGSFEPALRALAHLPETRATCEQAIDLRLALRSALRPLGEFGRILVLLREAEALAETLDDSRRLGQLSRFLTNHFRVMGTYDQAIAADQRTLALATADGDGVAHALANQELGYVYRSQGDYRRPIDCFRQTMAALDGTWRRERFGQLFLPAVISRAHLAECHAELGTFPEGRALGDEGPRIAEAVDHPASLMAASWGMGLRSLRQGDLPRALPRLERAMDLCQEADIPAYFPQMAGALGAAYTLARRRRRIAAHAGGGAELCTRGGGLSDALSSLPGEGADTGRWPGGGARPGQGCTGAYP